MTGPANPVAAQVVQAETIVRGIDGHLAVMTGLRAWAHVDCRPARTGWLRRRRGPVVHTSACRTADEALVQIRALQQAARAELEQLRRHAVRYAVLTAVGDAASARAGEGA